MKMDNLKKVNLPNGIRIICKRNATNPTVSFFLKCSSGSVSEKMSQMGLSNFAGALITKGTEKRSPAEIAMAIDSLGMDMSFGAGRHTSGLSGRFLSDKHLPALKLATEVLSTPNPPQDEFERMRQRILTGVAMKMDDPAAVSTDKLSEMIFGPEHPYGRSMVNILKTLPDLTLDKIKAFHSENLRPGSFIGVIIGDIDLDSIEEDLRKTLGRWKGDGGFNIEMVESVEPPDKPKLQNIPMPGKTQSDVALGFPGIDRKHEDYYALQVGNTVLGRLSLGGRVGQRVRDTEGMAYYAYTTFDAGIGAGPYLFRAGVNPANVDRAVELALEEMRKVRDNGITREEMNDAVIYLAGSMARQVETNGGMAATILSQELFDLGDDYYLRFPSILEDLTLDQVNAALARHLKPDNYCLVVAGPEEQEEA